MGVTVIWTSANAPVKKDNLNIFPDCKQHQAHMQHRSTVRHVLAKYKFEQCYYYTIYTIYDYFSLEKDVVLN